MRAESKKLHNLISKSKKILLLTHRGPDLDAFCSMLILFRILRKHYSKKEVVMQAKQLPNTNLHNMHDISQVQQLNSTGFDLIIITDAGDIDMCMEKNGDHIEYESTPLVFIDHHRTELAQPKDTLVINNLASSATEEVYTTFKDILGKKLSMDKEIAELIQFGIVFDTERFLYENTTSNSMRLFAEAKDVSPIDLEEFTYKYAKFPIEATPAIIEYLKSLKTEKDMAYMSISKEKVKELNLNRQGINEAQSYLRDRYLRFIQGIHWGFIIRPDFELEDGWYVSFRSIKGYQEVAPIAEELGGGGHTYAAGLRIEGKTEAEVLEKVLTVVRKYL